ncbi:Glycosyltransferase involved in cell wall bisynthesis [Catalinimonas alkaloidigena]|uniref:Glycosyltransferase involved in cell wall bisynthesis n=1 Tax=Catalinimonas alkaloidigena TaxID=1075417 RepID=A0A1G9B3W1_9BACT|nr:glycosyltransferase family 4 protein [Catalinimonas alkaloidigena]SDK33690.1 Glycosyltransferase involved in cell wall bisynthesis [Catalinimonas alkaloidigena]
MRVLFIHNFYQIAGGEDTVFRAEKALLEERGHAVEALLFDNDAIQSTKDKLLTGLRGLYNPVSATLLRQKIQAFRPDLIHIHNFFPLASPSVFYEADRQGVPVVLTLHNYRLLCPSAFLYHDGQIYEANVHCIFPIDGIRKGVYRDSRMQTANLGIITGMHKLLGTFRKKVSRFIALTEFGKQKFLDSSLHLSPEQIAVKPNFTEDLGLGYEEREPYFLFVGRLSEEKGIDNLLQAFRAAPFPLKIIGDGPLRSKVEAVAAENPQLEYLGFQEKSQVIEAMKQCTALLFPSLWYETMGMTILEAFSTGTPAIASRIGGPADIVVNEYNGLHFEPHDWQQLRAHVDRLLQEKTLLKKMQAGARESYERHYTPERNYQQLIRIYEDVLAEKKALARP